MDADRREQDVRDRLTDLAGADPSPAERALLARVVGNFRSDAPGGLDRLGELLRGGTAPEVRDHAHRLSGSASNLGAAGLAAILAEVEHAAASGVVPDPDLTRGRLGGELARVLEVLEIVAKELDQ